jgi:hypothetical protein
MSDYNKFDDDDMQDMIKRSQRTILDAISAAIRAVDASGSTPSDTRAIVLAALDVAMAKAYVALGGSFDLLRSHSQLLEAFRGTVVLTNPPQCTLPDGWTAAKSDDDLSAHEPPKDSN